MAMTPEQPSSDAANLSGAADMAGISDASGTSETSGKRDSGVSADVAPLGQRFLWADGRKGVNRLIVGLIILCLLLFAMEFVWHRHVKVPWESFTGFHAIAGFISFTVIVLGARLLRVLIRRDESFYAPLGVDAEDYPQAGTSRVPHANRHADSLKSLRDEMMGRGES